MADPDGSPPQSLCMIRAAELFPKPKMEKEDTQLTVPFQELAGESVKYLGRTDDGVLALSNYRLFLLKNSTNSETSVPLGLIESAQSRDLFHLMINCKDASTVKCSFEQAEQCTEWQRRIQLAVSVPETLESLFAFPFYSWSCDAASSGSGSNTSANTSNGACNVDLPPTTISAAVATGASSALNGIATADFSERLQRASRYEDNFMREVERLGFDLNGPWRVSHANEDFKLCPSYPQKILVPCCISDEMLNAVANFRGSRRLPAVVWRHRKSGAVIARCSQPEVGWLGWRNHKDEQLLKAIADACAFDRGERQRHLAAKAAAAQNTEHSSNATTATITSTTAAAAAATTTTVEQLQAQATQCNTDDNSSATTTASADSGTVEVAMDEVRKILIVDARSYTSAVTNRARGGGCECIEYYPCAEIEFMSLGNIHAIRKSFHALRQLYASPPDVPNWLGLLEKTMWLQHLSGLLAASVTVCHAIEKKGRPVLVHCSDGWDRTPQIVATAQLCLDPFYRTVEGFRILVEREWLSYGHKFADRCGHGPESDELNERCPVFLQWLDLVHQIHKQFPCSFEFSMAYLIKLAQHSHSCLFGTFLCNTLRERIENSVFERTFSVWPFLSGPIYKNHLYVPNKEKVLWPAHNVRDLYLWNEVYLGSLGNQNCIDFPTFSSDAVHGSISPLAKTRSYGDLITAGIMSNGLSRRSSDPNMAMDQDLAVCCSSSETNSTADLQSECEDAPDNIATFIHDTTRQLQNLTIELNNQHEEDFKKSATVSNANSVNELTKTHEEATLTKLKELQNGFGSNAQEELDETLTAAESLNKLNAVNAQNSETMQNANADTQLLHLNNGFDKLLHDLSDMRGSEQPAAVVPNAVTLLPSDLMLQSVNLSDCNSSILCNTTDATHAVGNEDLWHGSITTSTDTLVPIEHKQQRRQSDDAHTHAHSLLGKQCDETDAGVAAAGSVELADNAKATITSELFKETEEFQTTTAAMAIGTNCSILPKVHSMRANLLTSSQAALSSSVESNKSVTAVDGVETASYLNSNCDSLVNQNATNTCNGFANATTSAAAATATTNCMEDSIMILPEHQKLEISFSGKCETVPNAFSFTPNSQTSISNGSGINCFNYAPTYAAFATASAQRRRRTSSSNSRRDVMLSKQISGSNANGSTRFSLPGVRSLPMTPPGLPERTQMAISCPDGLAHALSEQNIRLQQIVHEHKLREDVLLREIHDMRMALLKKICPSCNNPPITNDEQ